eukprot:12905725-Prorocentrum_lima.AAC.1
MSLSVRDTGVQGWIKERLVSLNDVTQENAQLQRQPAWYWLAMDSHDQWLQSCAPDVLLIVKARWAEFA